MLATIFENFLACVVIGKNMKRLSIKKAMSSLKLEQLKDGLERYESWICHDIRLLTYFRKDIKKILSNSEIIDSYDDWKTYENAKKGIFIICNLQKIADEKEDGYLFEKKDRKDKRSYLFFSHDDYSFVDKSVKLGLEDFLDKSKPYPYPPSSGENEKGIEKVDDPFFAGKVKKTALITPPIFTFLFYSSDIIEMLSLKIWVLEFFAFFIVLMIMIKRCLSFFGDALKQGAFIIISFLLAINGACLINFYFSEIEHLIYGFVSIVDVLYIAGAILLSFFYKNASSERLFDVIIAIMFSLLIGISCALFFTKIPRETEINLNILPFYYKVLLITLFILPLSEFFYLRSQRKPLRNFRRN